MRPMSLALPAASALALFAAALPATAQPPAAAAKAKAPAQAQAETPALQPGQVAVKVQCRGMPDGTLKECKALESQPKNPQAEQAAVQLAGQQRGKPPADWPAAGKVLVLPLVLTPQKGGG